MVSAASPRLCRGPGGDGSSCILWAELVGSQDPGAELQAAQARPSPTGRWGQPRRRPGPPGCCGQSHAHPFLWRSRQCKLTARVQLDQLLPLHGLPGMVWPCSASTPRSAFPDTCHRAARGKRAGQALRRGHVRSGSLQCPAAVPRGPCQGPGQGPACHRLWQAG